MKYIWGIVIVLVISSCSTHKTVSEDVIKKVWIKKYSVNKKTEIRDGKYEEIFRDFKFIEGNYKNGVREGKWKFYSQEDKYIEAEYSNDKKHGEWKYYDKNGVFFTATYEADAFVKETSLSGKPPITEIEDLYTAVQEMPIFPDGNIMGYIARAVRYPKEARDLGISGTVYVTFVVDPTGEVRDIAIVRKPEGGELLANEVIRVVSEMPRWFPGFQDDRPVPVKFTLPVRFSFK